MSESKSRLYIFDFIRALAVLFVIFGHYLVHHHHYEEHNEIWIKIHGVGVGMFFFISGYLIFMTMQKSNMKIFLGHRFFRIAPALAAAMAFFALFNRFFSGKCFLLGILFLGDFFGKFGVYGIDTWTLHTETRFYLLASLIYFLLINKRVCKASLLTSYLLASLIIFGSVLFLNIHFPGISFASPKWNIFCIFYLLFGVIFYFYEIGDICFHEFLISSVVNILIIFFIKIGFFGFALSNVWKDNYLSAVIFCLGLIAIKDKIPYSKIIVFIAFISYPLYLVHHDMIIKWGLLGIPIMIAVAYIITVLIEQPMMKWSKRILR